MTATAVVTGSPTRVADVSEALERRGITSLAFRRGDDMRRSGAALAMGSVQYYLQLPDDVASPTAADPGRGTTSRAVAALLGQGLLSRFCEVETMLSKLAPACAVVLVTGETVEDLPRPAGGEYPHAPTCVLEMLAEAIVTDLVPLPVRATVVSHRHSADQIAEIALATGPQRADLVAGYADRAPELSFDDWRLACLCTTGPGA